MEDKAHPNDPTTKKKKEYRKPELDSYGKVKDVTAGGSGLRTEAGGGVGPTFRA